MEREFIKAYSNYSCCKILLTLIICLVGNTVFAVDVNDWTTLKTNVETGNSVTLTNNITANSSSTTITISSSKSPFIDLAEKYISGNNLIKIFNNAGSLSISDGTIKNGYSSTNGGGISNTGTLTVSGVTFTNNKTSSSRYGGAIYNTDIATISECNFGLNTSGTGNSAHYGGAIYNTETGTMTLNSGNTFYYNTAIDGSAILNAGKMTIKSGNNFYNNSGSDYGSAVYNSGNLTISGCNFGSETEGTGNSARIGGGAFFNNHGTVTITSSKFYHNTAPSGGVIYNYIGSTIDTISGCTFTDNKSTDYGGAIANYYSSSTINSILNDTFTENSASISGGAFYNLGKIDSISIGTFTKNSALNFGGAIYNVGTITSLSGGTFKYNKANISGGAIYNSGTLNISGNATFDSNYISVSTAVTTEIQGGAISNVSSTKLTIDDITFNENYLSIQSSTNGITVTAKGGAFYNIDGTATTVSNSIFSDNYVTATETGTEGTAQSYGGAIYNKTTDLTVSNSTFSNNSVTASATGTNGNSYAYGGAIYNDSGTLTINNLSSFDYNSADMGGAIYNEGSLAINNVTFENNSAEINGGAINNSGTNVSVNGSFKNNSAVKDGGAINNTGTISSLDGIFENNSSKTNGGAVCNQGTISSLSGTYTDNSATNNEKTAQGGAICNFGTITTLSDGTFTGNTASIGGAIYNEGNITISGGTFKNNSSTTDNGGAIFNNSTGTAYLKAVDSNMTFTGNTANGSSNALYNYNGTVNLNTDTEYSITFNDAITSFSNSSGSINVNAGSSLNSGTVNFYNQNLNTSNDIALTSGTINLHSTPTGATYINDNIVGSSTDDSIINIITDDDSGEKEGKFYINKAITNSTIKVFKGDLIIKDESYLNGNNMIFYGCNLNTQNNLIGDLDLETLIFTVDCNPHWMLDVNLANQKADTITASNITPYENKKITINSINLLSDTNSNSTTVNVANSVLKDYITNNVSSVDGYIYKYGISYDSSSGNLNFVKTGFVPGAITSDVAQTQAFLLQTAIDRQFFANTEAFMSFPLAARESSICCALSNGNTTGAACPILGNGTFSPIYSCDLNKGIWVKTFTSFENIPLRNGPNVSTIEYGTLIGMDAPLTSLQKGWVGNSSVYVGYLGSNQNYDGVGVSQNGVLIGLAENIIKGNNFLTLMANVGSSTGIANTKYGNDYFNSIFAGLAIKGGHNFEFKAGKYIIQPTLMLAYTYTYTPPF